MQPAHGIDATRQTHERIRFGIKRAAKLPIVSRRETDQRRGMPIHDRVFTRCRSQIGYVCRCNGREVVGAKPYPLPSGTWICRVSADCEPAEKQGDERCRQRARPHRATRAISIPSSHPNNLNDCAGFSKQSNISAPEEIIRALRRDACGAAVEYSGVRSEPADSLTES
jgi:hypothetical protein